MLHHEVCLDTLCFIMQDLAVYGEDTKIGSVKMGLIAFPNS